MPQQPTNPAEELAKRAFEETNVRIKLPGLVKRIVQQEDTITGIKVNNKEADVKNLEADLNSMKRELEGFLGEHKECFLWKYGREISSDELIDEWKNPRKWYQRKRSKPAADLLRPSKH